MQNIATSLSIPRGSDRASDTAATINPPRPWLQDIWLWLLLVGPLTAPLFAWTGWGVLKPFADGIYLLGAIVCPKLSEHFELLGNPFSVCASCWSAVFGLWTIRILYGRAGEGMGPFSRLNLSSLWARWQSAPLTTRLAVLTIAFMPWAIDTALWDTNTWSSPRIFMMLVGYLGGIGAGLLLLPAASAMRARLSTKQSTHYEI
jgi:hypothetical protein